VNREWSYISNSSNVIDDDAAQALYWSFICSDSDDDDQDACAIGHIHSWIDDISACPTAATEGCTITVPSGRDGFIADLAIEGAFRYLDGGSAGDGTLDANEQAWFNLHRAVSSWSQWAPSGLIASCDTESAPDAGDQDGALTKDELYDCWVANVPDCLVSDFDTAFADVWGTQLDLGDADTLDAAAVTALEGVLAEVSDWHSSSTDGHNHEACPTTRRLSSFFASFFN